MATKKTSGAAQTAQLRAFALALPGAREDFPWGESVAKVGKKVFVFLGRDDAEKEKLSPAKKKHAGEPGSFGISVKLLDEAAVPRGGRYGDMPWDPKLAFDAIAERYAR